MPEHGSGRNSHVNRNRTESKGNFLCSRKNGDKFKECRTSGSAQEILDEENEILKANAADVARAKERGMAPGLVDRLELNHKRIEGIVEGMRQVVGLDDPVGEVISMKKRPNGLLIGQKRVPLGVIGIIYDCLLYTSPSPRDSH